MIAFMGNKFSRERILRFIKFYVRLEEKKKDNFVMLLAFENANESPSSLTYGMFIVENRSN